MKNNSIGIYTAAVLAMFFWSLSYIWYKEVFQFYKPITLVVGRLSISAIFLFITVGLIMRKLTKMKVSDLKYFLLLAFFEPFLYFIGESFGMTMVSPTLGAVIIATIPLFSPLGEFYLYNTRITLMNFIGVLFSVIGVAMVVFYRGFGKLDANPLGIACMFLAVFAGLSYSLALRKLTERYSVFTIITYQNTIALIYFIPLFFIFEFNHFLTVGVSLRTLIPVVKLGIIASTFAFLLFMHSVKHLGVTKANAFANAIPVMTAFLSYFLINETITLVKALGIVMVVLGLFLSQIPQKRFRNIFAFIPVGLITRARLRKNE
ncbi:DMT family transporter [Tenuifilum osseticum]|uniref:DMT family transporter n=1 Tax=Tenuifilum osseticum TaxID=3374723 RepID=UPI0034E383A6